MTSLAFSKLLERAAICRFCSRISNHYSFQTRSLYATSKLDIDEKPKRPLNAFFSYSKKIGSDIQSKHPDMSQQEKIKLIAQNYNLLSEQEMEVLSHEYSEKLEKYKTELERWESSLSADQKAMLQEQEQQKRGTKKQRRGININKKMNKELEKPKKTLTSFLLFIQDRRTQKSPDENNKAWTKKMGEEWAALPAEQKKVYEEKYKTLKATYEEDLYNWELKMIEMDHLDLVRKSTLNKLDQEE